MSSLRRHASVLLALACFALGDAALSRNANAIAFFEKSVGRHWRHADDVIRVHAAIPRLRRKAPPRILLVGSSSVAYGFSSQMIHRQAGRSSWETVGIRGLQGADLYCLTPLIRSARPDVVIVGLNTSLVVRREREFHIWFHPRVMGPLLRRVGWAHVLRHTSRFADALLQSVFFTLRCRESIRGALESRFLGAPEAGGPSSMTGTYATPAYTRLHEPLFLQSLKELSRDSLLIVVEMPEMRSRSRARVRTSRRLAAAAANAVRQGGGVFIRRNELPAFFRGDFKDPWHLNARGRSKMTPYLVRRVREVMAERSRRDPVQAAS